VLWEFADHGRPLRITPDEATALAQHDLVVVDEHGFVVGAYPFTLRPTGHRLEMPRSHINAMCSLDAVAVAPVFFTDVVVRSSCAVSNQPITIHQNGDLLVDAHPSSPWLGIGLDGVRGTASASLCRNMVFFAGETEANEWSAEQTARAATFDLTDAIALGTDFFGPLAG
jgi:mercuric reductase